MKTKFFVFLSAVLAFALLPLHAQTSTNAGEVSPTDNVGDTVTETDVVALIEEIVAEVAEELDVDLSAVENLNEVSETIFAQDLSPAANIIASRTEAAVDAATETLTDAEKAADNVNEILARKLVEGESIDRIVGAALNQNVALVDIIKGLLVGGLPASAAIEALLSAGVPEQDIVDAVKSVVEEAQS